MKNSILMILISSTIVTVVTFSASIGLSKTKKTVCSMTINSDNEIEAFKKGLPKDQFDFVELTLSGKDSGDDQNWLRNSCKMGVKCDVLVVSGHFAGSFFGSSGLKLSIEDLESASCDQSCSGIFHDPKEVFLFGCNTLAGKNQDSRSPEQYVQVLVEDGFSYEEARAVASFRYSPLGSSFSDRMSRVFSKVPRIYGFSSIAPSGENGTPYLKNYLKTTGSTYFDYLANLASDSNKVLKQNFKDTALVQVSGKQDLNTPVCYINNQNLSNEKKLSYILSIMDQGGILELAPFMVSYFSKLDVQALTAQEKLILQKIYNHKSSKQRLEGFIQKPAPGLIKAQVDVLNLMVTLTWSSASEYDNAISRLVLEPFYNNPLVSTEIKDQICSMNLTVVAIDPRRVKDKNWSNPDFYLALECMKPINADLMAVIVSKMPEMIKRDALPAGILAILGNAKYQTPQTIEVLSSLLFLRNPPLWDLYSYARETGTESPYFKKQLLKAFEQGQGADVYRILLYVHRNDHAFIDPVIENALKASSFAERLDNEYLLADVIETPLVFEKVLAAVNSMNPLQQETALRLIQGKSNLVRNKMLPTLTQIVKGNYPLVSRMLSLSIIIEETKGLANWNQYLKDIYLSGVPYQLRQLAFKNYDGDKKMSPSDIKLSPSKIDNSVPLFKFDDATDVGNSSVQTVVLGISQDAVPSDASKEDLLRYGFQLHRRTIDKRTNMVIGFEPINE